MDLPTIQQAGQTSIPTQNEGDNQPSSNDSPDSWKEPYLRNETLKPFAESSETYDEFVKKTAEGYENLSKKQGNIKEELKKELEDENKTTDPSKEIPENIEGYELGEGSEWFAEAAKDMGMSKDMAKSLQTKYNEQIESLIKEQDAQLESDLKKEWGDNFDANLTKVKAFFANNLNPEDAKYLNQLDNNVQMMLAKVSMNLMEKYQDNQNVPQSSSQVSGVNLESLEREYKEILVSDDYRKPTAFNKTAHERARTRLIEVSKQIREIKGD